MKTTWPNGMTLERRLSPPHLLYVDGKLIGEVERCGVAGNDTHYTVRPVDPSPSPTTVENPIPGQWYDASTHLPRPYICVEVRGIDGEKLGGPDGCKIGWYHKTRGLWYHIEHPTLDHLGAPVAEWRISS